ncbi:MAG: VWA domain-containing protein [Desulfobacteraceae bacterium]|jgi:hypothetical protein
MKTNSKPSDYRLDKTARLAGGYGPFAAKQDAEALLRRAVMSCLLWEDLAYESDGSVAKNIKELIAQVDPKTVYDIAIEAKFKQKLRHVPLFIAREMARLDSHKSLVGDLLSKIIVRADELAEFVAIYWKDGKQPLSKQVKIGLAAAFNKFDEYQLYKYNSAKEIKLRDVMFLVHPNPGQLNTTGVTAGPVNKPSYKRGEVLRHEGSLLDKLTNGTLEQANTWENSFMTGKDKKQTWIDLIESKKAGALAFVRNLRKMEEIGVPEETILKGFKTVNPRWLLPLTYMAAARHAPKYMREIEELMLRGLAMAPRLKGHTVFAIDVSGSMSAPVSGKTLFTRMHVAAAMAMLASEMCERISVYATAGSDWKREHATELIKPYRGFALSDAVIEARGRLGGGGIFTRQCLEYIRERETGTPDRIIIFSDSQDCDHPHKRIPNPFGRNNYIVDVSSHKHGINYDGLWTAEVSGWSEHFLAYIAALEGVELSEQETE